MNLFVLPEVGGRGERLAADGAHVSLDAQMGALVHCEMGFLAVSFPTGLARVRLAPGVGRLVQLETVGRAENLGTLAALVDSVRGPGGFSVKKKWKKKRRILHQGRS